MFKLKYILIIAVLIVSCTKSTTTNVKEKIFFMDDFGQGISIDKWDLINSPKIQVVESNDPNHGKVLSLHPGAPVHALIKGSGSWAGIKIEGDVLFPEDEHNYMGLIYNYNVRGTRVDYGCIYIKGNGSYIRVNPHRDYQVSRTIYEEYKTVLSGNSAIIIGKWQHFKAEVMGSICHFYVGDMETPKVTFRFFEFSSGRLGFEPRIYGSHCWLDNITVRSIDEFSYKGPILPPHILYKPRRLISKWDVIGPFRRRKAEIEKDPYSPGKVYPVYKRQYTWKPFNVDGRGCVVSGRIFEFAGQKWLAYFHSEIFADRKKTVKIQFSTTNGLTVWLNGHPVGEVEPTYNAWYDFWENPAHKGGELEVKLEEGVNHLLIRAKGVGRKYSGDGFFAHIDTKD
jgi:hypothetical protein